jgi:exonuclease SbcC
MQIREVRIGGFGPLASEDLVFAPGLTVVYGPNESAKTTLHAATYAAICGMRRSRGQPRREDAQFAARFRPWNDDPWQVAAVIRLEDGREIELSHELGGFACSARDVALGRDVSNEIMFDGNPDASRWLGFDRTSFVATACVRQAEIAAVLTEAGALQDELQRAAATAGRDETAAEAIEGLRAFLRENVGLDRANSTRPLRRAKNRLDLAERALVEAQERHDAYLASLASLDEQEQARESAFVELRTAEAIAARGDADSLAQRIARASALSARYPVEPSPAAGEEELADAVSHALAVWEAAPPEPDLSGPTTAELEAELASLPKRPAGDLAPAQALVEAAAALGAAEEMLRRHEEAEPETPNVDTTAEELHGLADELAEAPEVDERARARVEELRANLIKPKHAKRAPLVAAAVLALAGLALAAAANLALGIAIAVAGALVAVAAVWTARHQPDAAAADALAAAQRMLVEQEERSREIEVRRATAIERLKQLRIAPAPDAVRAAANDLTRWSTWEEARSGLAERRDRAAALLDEALAAHELAAGEDPRAAVATYKEACSTREQQNREAMRRPKLEQRLAERKAAEAAAAARSEARVGLVDIAQRIGLEGDDPAGIAEGLRRWQGQRANELDAHDLARQEWKELQMLLDGRTPDELRSAAEQLARRADELADGLDPFLLKACDAESERDRIPVLRQAVEERAEAFNHARGQLKEMAHRLPSVSEAEESLDAAQKELERVTELDRTLTLAIRFLEAAQERVHRDIAPVLRRTLEAWLPRVAVERQNGMVVQRYKEVTVDPETLTVRVRLGDVSWRDASLLSEGTKEQIYLLLRAALAEHLTTSGEKAPLLLDEITAQCDSTRRTALLDLLHELSRDRQVILFTHDEGALAWAERALDVKSGQDRLEIRTPVPVA